MRRHQSHGVHQLGFGNHWEYQGCLTSNAISFFFRVDERTSMQGGSLDGFVPLSAHDVSTKFVGRKSTSQGLRGV